MNKQTTVITVVIVIIVLVVAAVFIFGNHNAAPQAQAPSQPPSQTQAQPEKTPIGLNAQKQPSQPSQPTPAPVPAPTAGSYVSPDDGFSANFSGTPTISKTQFNSLTAGSIPLTQYKVQSGSGSSTKYSAISVYHYPKSYVFPSGYLNAAIQIFAMGIAAKYPGTKLTSASPAEFAGNPAISGVITVPVSGKQETAYLIITTKGQNTYGIGTYGMDQASYTAFVNSFTFTQ